MDKHIAFLPLLSFFLFALHAHRCEAFNPRVLFLVKPDPIVLDDHHGVLITGNFSVNLLFYGRFTRPQRTIITDFVRSISAVPDKKAPSVASWWRTTSSYRGGGARLRLGMQFHDESMSLGRSLSLANITALASKVGHHRNAITVVLTAPDVLVGAFCMSRCGVHDHALGGARARSRYTYLWVGDSAKQCPGQCAWPFHKPLHGPQTPPLRPPNGDVGVDGMVISLAALLAGTVTNPYGDGYYQGVVGAELEAATACAGIFGSGAYPGYPGKLLTDPTTRASYNAVGLRGRKYLLPALWDPTKSQCTTLV